MNKLYNLYVNTEEREMNKAVKLRTTSVLFPRNYHEINQINDSND